MSVLTRCLHQPQRIWLRRAFFQIHLWTGLALGLYVVVLSVTGSALVYRAELDRFLATPRATLDERATPMSADELRAAAARVYPGWTVAAVHEGRYQARAGGPGGRQGGPGGPRRPPDPTATIELERGAQTMARLFNPYTGEDLGVDTTRGQFFLLWVTRL